MKLIPYEEIEGTKGVLEIIRENKISVAELEEICKRMEQVECPVFHEFADGIYSRVTMMPKGTFAIGKRHKYRTYNILLKGEITVYMGENEPIKRIKAPSTFVSDALVRKVAYFHEDTVWINIHPTVETDLEKIEEQFIIPEDKFTLDGKPGDIIQLSKPLKVLEGKV